MNFEWNEKKSVENVRKHGVSFEIAQRAFLDKHRKIYHDEKHSAGENRYFCYGMMEDEVLTVRFTTRKESIRIIGAGYWRKGKKVYHEEQE